MYALIATMALSTPPTTAYAKPPAYPHPPANPCSNPVKCPGRGVRPPYIIRHARLAGGSKLK